MTDLEKTIWLAGLLEGEGCFTTTGAKKSYVAVYLVSTDKDVVETASEIMDCKVQTLKRISSVSRKPQYRAVVQGDKARKIMRNVLPFMGHRRTVRITELLEADPR